MENLKFYHAGCPVCVAAENELLNLIDGTKANVEIIHLGEEKAKIAEAEDAGVKSVPALLMDNGSVLHINYGAGINDLK
ncbi:MAG: thioredoxin family protein [Bacteroidota bacterium]